jgi:hypothetical protein
MAYDDFKLRSSGKVPSTNYYKDMLQAKLNSVFNLASDVYTIKKLNRDTGLFEDITVRITPWFGETHDEDVKDDYKRIYFQSLDSQSFLGDMYEFDGYRWMTLNREGIKTVTKDCTVRRCNIQLKFKHSSMSDPTIVIDAIASRKMMFTESGQYVELPRGKLEVFIPNNEDSKKLQIAPKPTKFLLGNKEWDNKYQPWIIESIDSISFVRNTIDYSAAHGTGYVVLRLTLDQLSPKDDMVNGIAWQNYYS